jgi:hypothetical protein
MLMEAPTPSTTAIAGEANTSPLTMVNDKLGNVSPAGSTGNHAVLGLRRFGER